MVQFYKRNWRYVCPYCLRTFVDNNYHEDMACWECGFTLEVIPKRDSEVALSRKDDYILEVSDLLYDHQKIDEILCDSDVMDGYICRCCAIKLNAVAPRGHVCTWHRGICDFCSEEANLCHTSDWNWPDFNYLEEGREL